MYDNFLKLIHISQDRAKLTHSLSMHSIKISKPLLYYAQTINVLIILLSALTIAYIRAPTFGIVHPRHYLKNEFQTILIIVKIKGFGK